MAEDRGAAPSGADARALEIACQQFVELVTDLLEGALPADVERAVADHLALCDPCVEYVEQMRSTTAALRSLPRPTLAPAVRDELLDVFAQLHPPRPPGG